MTQRIYELKPGKYFIGDVFLAMDDEHQNKVWGAESFYSFMDMLCKVGEKTLLVLNVMTEYNVNLIDSDGYRYELFEGCIGFIPADLVQFDDVMNINSLGYRIVNAKNGLVITHDIVHRCVHVKEREQQCFCFPLWKMRTGSKDFIDDDVYCANFSISYALFERNIETT